MKTSAAQKRYDTSLKGRATQKRYRDSLKGKSTERRLSVSLNGKFIDGRDTAKEDGREWSLNFAEYVMEISSGCFYCGADLLTIGGVSLDRIDNSKGYTLDNVLPCCGNCNMIRGNKLTVEEMQHAMIAVLTVRKL
jgi:hypothetical protein